MSLNEKVKISILAPYKIIDGEVWVYMQKRSAHQKVPNGICFWGGHAEENETPEITLQREIKEELGLDLDMDQVKFFNHYESLNSLISTFVLPVEDGWEEKVVIGEGEYGLWLSVSEGLKNELILTMDKVKLNDLERVFLGKPQR